ncbi:MAG: hypothetical protein Q4G33_11260 [bacterium]|nr:hypothetical protein [bacterium]
MTTAQRLVTNYFTSNPDARQADCVLATGLSASTVCRYWPNKQNRYKEKVLQYLNDHSGVTKTQCRHDTGLSFYCISKYWPIEARDIHINAKELVEQFYKENPDALQKECVVETGVNAATVSKHWPGRKKKCNSENPHMLLTSIA